jgi:SAM-dependent methyltransferase
MSVWPPVALRKNKTINELAVRYGAFNGAILNVGSKSVRYGTNCVNVDIIAAPGVDVVADAHELTKHFAPQSFDTVVLSAMLQYCADPRLVIAQAAEVLRPNGLIMIDAPFLQPYCPDGPDLWRFTDRALRHLCDRYFVTLEIVQSIGAGSAIAFTAQTAARCQPNRGLALTLSWLITVVVWPLTFLKQSDPSAAGAFILVGQKK